MERKGRIMRRCCLRSFVIACSLVFSASLPALEVEGTESAIEQALLALKADPIIVKQLLTTGFIAEEGDDAQLRPRYVGTQAAFEQFFARELALGRLKQVIAVIHTPLPATPLCTEGEITPDLVDPSILQDEKRLQTVRERPAILRALLHSGGTIIASYPAMARSKRSPAQLGIFESLLAKYPMNLLDMPLGCLEIVPEMVGATYLFQGVEGQWRTFSIRRGTLSLCFTQAVAPKSPAYAAMWLGDVDQEGPASERLALVSAYLQACQGPNLISYISENK